MFANLRTPVGSTITAAFTLSATPACAPTWIDCPSPASSVYGPGTLTGVDGGHLFDPTTTTIEIDAVLTYNGAQSYTWTVNSVTLGAGWAEYGTPVVGDVEFAPDFAEGFGPTDGETFNLPGCVKFTGDYGLATAARVYISGIGVYSGWFSVNQGSGTITWQHTDAVVPVLQSCNGNTITITSYLCDGTFVESFSSTDSTGEFTFDVTALGMVFNVESSVGDPDPTSLSVSVVFTSTGALDAMPVKAIWDDGVDTGEVICS